MCMCLSVHVHEASPLTKYWGCEEIMHLSSSLTLLQRTSGETEKAKQNPELWKMPGKKNGWMIVGESTHRNNKENIPPLCLASPCLRLCEVLPAWDFIMYFHFRARSRLAGICRQAGLLQLLPKPAAALNSILLLFLIPLPSAGKLCDSSRQTKLLPQ